MRTSILLGLVASVLVVGVAQASAPPAAPAVRVFTHPTAAVPGVRPNHHFAPPARLSPAALRAGLDAVRAQVAPTGNPPPPNPPPPPPPLRSFTTWTTPQSEVSLVFVGASEIAENQGQDYAVFNSAGGMLTTSLYGLQQSSYYMLDCSANVAMGGGNWGTSGSISISVFEGPPQVVPVSGGHLLFAFQGAPNLAVHLWVDPTTSPGETGWEYYGCDLHAVT